MVTVVDAKYISARLEDSAEDHERLTAACRERGIDCVSCDPWSGGGNCCAELGEAVAAAADSPSEFRHLYQPEAPYADKLRAIVQSVYGGADVEISDPARRKIERCEKHGNALDSNRKTKKNPTRSRPGGVFCLAHRQIRETSVGGPTDYFFLPPFGAGFAIGLGAGLATGFLAIGGLH